MQFSRKNLFSAMALTVATAIATGNLNAQPGHGFPPPGQVKHDGRRGGPPDFRMDQSRRDQLARHYGSDVRRWNNNKRRPQFTRGYTIPRNYSIRPVPRSYWAGMAPPPAGYQYGYYDGYVVTYNPTTRIIADVMDLVGAAISR